MYVRAVPAAVWTLNNLSRKNTVYLYGKLLSPNGGKGSDVHTDRQYYVHDQGPLTNLFGPYKLTSFSTFDHKKITPTIMKPLTFFFAACALCIFHILSAMLAMESKGQQIFDRTITVQAENENAATSSTSSSLSPPPSQEDLYQAQPPAQAQALEQDVSKTCPSLTDLAVQIVKFSSPMNSPSFQKNKQMLSNADRFHIHNPTGIFEKATESIIHTLSGYGLNHFKNETIDSDDSSSAKTIVIEWSAFFRSEKQRCKCKGSRCNEMP